MPTKAQHDPRYLPLPQLLIGWRTAAELTQRQIGALLDKPQSWVFNCETGNRRVDLGEFVAWCIACKVDPEEGLRQYIRKSPKPSRRRR